MELHAAGTRWAIATPHTVATEAGAVAFERGGNALDAALVAAVTLAVSYPHNCGVGGDLFALVQRPDGSTVAINASGRAPAGVDADGLRDRHGAAMPEEGPDSITVPGAVSGWAALHAEGATLPWAEAFGPAIALAHGGVAVSRSLSRALTERRALLAADPGMRDVFFHDGVPLPRGALFRQPALGVTLRELAGGGPLSLYGGPLGERYAAGLRASGAPLTADDLAAHRADVVPPLSGRYRSPTNPRAAAIRSSEAAANSTCSPARATRTTSSRVRSRPVRTTVIVRASSPNQRPAEDRGEEHDPGGDEHDRPAGREIPVVRRGEAADARRLIAIASSSVERRLQAIRCAAMTGRTINAAMSRIPTIRIEIADRQGRQHGDDHVHQADADHPGDPAPSVIENPHRGGHGTGSPIVAQRTDAPAATTTTKSDHVTVRIEPKRN